MCGCDGVFRCSRCREWWPDPIEEGDKELEQERLNSDLSRPDFLTPWGESR